MKRITGSALVDYLLPTLIVGLVIGLGIYGFTGDQYLKKFFIASGNMDESTNKKELIVGGKNLKGGSLGGTPAAPVIVCQFGGTCDIDYGSFILKEVPTEIDNLTNSMGNQGITAVDLTLLESMTEQIKDSNPGAYTKLKTLASIGHVMGDIQKTTEAKAELCKSDGDPMLCFKNWLNNPPNVNYSLPGEYATYLPDFASNNSMSTYDLLEHSYMGLFKTGIYPDPGTPPEDTYPGYAAIDAYDAIDGDGSIPQEIKDVTKELYRSLNDIGQNLYGISRSAKNGGTQSFSYVNPFTGANESSMSYTTTSMDNITNPTSTLRSHGDAYIICLSGRNSDAGSTCK